MSFGNHYQACHRSLETRLTQEAPVFLVALLTPDIRELQDIRVSQGIAVQYALAAIHHALLPAQSNQWSGQVEPVPRSWLQNDVVLKSWLP